MRRISVSLWTPLLAASLAGLIAGCGSGESDSVAPAGEEAVAIAPPPAPVVSQQDSMPGMGAAPEGEQTDAAEATAEVPDVAPATPPPAGVSNAAATDEILKLALNENKSLSSSSDAASSTTSADPNTSGGPPGSNSGYSQQMQGQGGSSSGGYGAPATSNSGGDSSYAQQMQRQGGDSGYSQQMQGQGGSSSGGYGAPASSNSSDGSNYAEMMRNQYGGSGGNSGGGQAGNSDYGSSSPALGGAVSALAKEPDFTNPIKGAESFLAAAATRDMEIIAQTIALRSEFEAIPKHKEIFSSILKRAVSQEMLDNIADAFKDMKVMSTNSVKSTAVLGVIVGRTEDSGDMTTWTLEMRREKAGWKLRDFTGPRVFKQPQMGNRNRGGNNAGASGGSSDYGSSGGDYSGSP